MRNDSAKIQVACNTRLDGIYCSGVLCGRNLFSIFVNKGLLFAKLLLLLPNVYGSLVQGIERRFPKP